MNTIPSYWYFVPAASLFALAMALYFYRYMKKQPAGNARMQEIAGYVREGALAYLKQQYKTVSVVFLVLFLVFVVLAVLKIQNPFVPVAFLTGGFFSGFCGFLGMKTATYASSRTAQGAISSLNRGLTIAFRSGAVMGLVVVGFGLLDISAWFFALNYIYDHHIWGFGMDGANKAVEITTTMLTFGMGASLQALFARVGGGIYTKAADVGADLVGKVEAGIPEDDPRNPATIADNVGDNVGDVAGMGADLYESYCGSILATAALGAALPGGFQYVIAPMIVAAIGIVLSVFGIFMVRTKEDAGIKSLLRSLLTGTLGSSVLILIALLVLVKLEFITLGIFGSVLSGLIAGVLIGQFTEYYTSDAYKPTQGIAAQAKMGAATTIIDGISVGMFSTGLPVVTIVIGIVAAFSCAGGFENMSMGLYGIGFAAVGMLSTLGITLASDAFGPIADNAGGNAEMAGLDQKVRERTDELDRLGNTTAATGKGFAIGSAALTAMALLASYVEEVKIWLGQPLSYADFMQFYNLNLMNPMLLGGLFIGAMMAFVFCGFTIQAVGRAASAMVKEVRRQFKEIPGIMDGSATPEYARCVEISTKGAQREMLLPSLLAVVVPVIVGLTLGVPGVFGLLVGGLGCGFSLATMLNNAGGAWDNAKKFVEKGNFGGKGSETHKAAVVGDTVGDPFKDTAGPSLNILIKLMTMVSVVFAGVVVRFGGVFF
ncbi:MAG: sodium-translocating pyrophosphatase [Fibrobacter sp.]|nr:sodium-translocating pyrophosphatase [Fibrobacter sp.]